MRRPVALAPFVSLTAAALLLAAACSDDEEGRGDAPIGERHESPRQVWVNADLFPNVSAFCIGPNGVYSNTRQSSAVVVIQDDANCAEGGILVEEAEARS